MCLALKSAGHEGIRAWKGTLLQTEPSSNLIARERRSMFMQEKCGSTGQRLLAGILRP